MNKNFIYTLPFVTDFDKSSVFDDKGLYAFIFLPDMTEAQINKILASINSESHNPIVYKQPAKYEYLKDRKVITMNGKDFILLRGWYELLKLGYMTIEAEEIQESLVEYIINKLTV